MAREKRFAIKLTRGELEILQRVLELAVSDASDQQMQELETIDSQVYAHLYPQLITEAGPPKLHKPDPVHPMPLRHLRLSTHR